MNKNELIHSAYLAYKDGQIDQALAFYQQLAKSDPMDLSTICMVAQCHRALGQLAEALKNYRRALLIAKKQKNQAKADIVQKKMIRIDPDSVTDFEIELAAVTEKTGEENGETQAVKQAVEQDKKNPELLKKAAETLEKQQLMAEAAKYYLALGNVFYGNKKFDQAIEVFQHILKIRPTFIQAHIALAESFIKQGSDSDAKKEYLYASEQLIRNGDLERGKLFAQKAIQLKSIEAHYYLGLVFLQNKKNEEARSEFETLLKFKVNHQGGLTFLAELLRDKKQINEAIGLYERLLKIDPKNADIMETWAQTANLQGDGNLAFEKYSQAMDAFAEQEEWERATYCAHEALQIQGENKELYLKFAEAAYNAGLVEQAAQGCNDLAAVLESQGNKSEADQMKQKAREILGQVSTERDEPASPSPETGMASETTPPIMDEPPPMADSMPPAEEPPVTIHERPPAPPEPSPFQAAPPAPAPAAQESNTTVMMNMADTYIQQGSLDEAIDIYQKILKKEPDNERVKSALTRVYAMFAGINPETAVARRGGGQGAAEKDDHQVQREAREKAQREAQVRSQRKSPPDGSKSGKSDTSNQGMINAIGNDKEDEIDGDNQDEFMTVTVAEIYTKQGLLNEALKIYQKILEIEPGNQEAKLKKEELEKKMKEQEALRQYSEKKAEQESAAVSRSEQVNQSDNPAKPSGSGTQKSDDDQEPPPPPKRRGRVSYV